MARTEKIIHEGIEARALGIMALGEPIGSKCVRVTRGSPSQEQQEMFADTSLRVGDVLTFDLSRETK